eukprot:CAMPEP_0116115964 /NCGR_PEP_ID=MMETSP0329-20121206/785_1 /TAXON_ID=697910 /ORGANISM="Pseudo-nitzschia arenysensis, Strain B593" /LENGTH=1188 /DNA_ID=CAMNT_0003609427 /DNA_START=62 /DNA_END=3628 /DNA_ORIENTATION=-
MDDRSEETLVTSGSGGASPKPKPKTLSKPKSRSRSKSKSRSKSRGKSSKSPGKSKSRTRSKSKSRKQKRENFGWWDLENDPELIAALEAEGLREKARIAQDEALLKRRQEIVRKFMQQHIDDMDAEEEERRVAAAASRARGVAQRFLQQVQQNERETKPVVLGSVRAAKLKIDVSKWEAPKYKKDADEKALIKQTAKKHFLFKDRKDYMKELSTTRSQKSNLNCGIASNTVAMMIKAFEPVNVDKGKAIIKQGALDQHLYVIDQGKVEFQVDDATVATGGAGTTFGDQNLLHAVPATKTVIATESTKVFRLHQETYRGILQQRHIVEDVKRQQKEIEEKDKAEKPEDSKSSEEEKEVEIKKATKKQKKKAKKVVEEEKVEEEKEDEEWWKDEKNAQLQIAIRDALARVHQDELERIKVLGEGQFGEVWLVAANLDVKEQEESKRYEFALKLQETYDEYREETAVHEIKIMREVSGYPFLSMLYRSYETEESKDMLLGLIPGGELWDTIHQEDEETGEWLSGLSEGHSRFYALLVADTLDYLHSKHYVFRDLKPENIMLDGWGYPIIVDFGFCKLLPKGHTDKTFTFCGTPNYISPEIVLNIGHNGAADCWALGIVVYEMISGINPFFWDDMDQVELYRSICEDAGEPLDEKHHSRQVRRLVDSLLIKDPDKRMKAKDILKHGWFEGLSLDMMRKRQVKAPWIPPGGEGENTEYICDYSEDAKTASTSHRKREQEIEEELERLKQEEEKRRLMREEEEFERLRLLAEEQERLEEEERLREEEERRIQEELEEQQRLEEEDRLREEEEQRMREEEEELRRQMELEEQRLREEEEERLRLEEEERLRLEEEERLREEEEERLRLEEAERLHVEEELRLQREEEERLRVEEELRCRQEEEERLRKEEKELQQRMEEERKIREEEERLRQEEEERQRKKELKRQKVLEEQRRREEEEERQRQKELRRQKMLEEHRQRKEEEERQKKLKEEEERLQKERGEEQRRLDEEEQRQREITRRRRMEMEELEKDIEEKEQEDQQRRLDEEEERQREVALRRRMELEAEMERHELKIEKDEQALFKKRQGHNNFHEGDYFVNKVQSWEQSPVPQPKRSFRSSLEDSPVPKGYVSKIIKDVSDKSPRTRPSKSPGALDVRKSVKKGIVAKRLSKAKMNEDPANIPSLFASFSILEKSKKR